MVDTELTTDVDTADSLMWAAGYLVVAVLEVGVFYRSTRAK